MGLFKRMEKKVPKLERKIEKKQKQIEKLRAEYNECMIADYDFISQKKRIEEKIKAMRIKVRILRDEIARKKRYMDEKARERVEQMRSEKKYFEWCKKNENI